MKKSILRIAAALFTIFLTLAALGMAKRVLGRKDSEFKYKPFFRTNTEYDVLFFGTSHVIDGIFPMQLWHDYGITSYNFGEHGTPIPTSYWIMRNAVRYHKPKIAALDINSIVEDKKMMENWIRISLDIFPLSPTKIMAAKDLTDSNNSGSSIEYMKFLFTYEIYHNRWKDFSIADIWDELCYSECTREKGADSRSLVAVPKYFPKTDETLGRETVAMEYIRKFVYFCKENDILPVLINIPYPADENEQRGANSAGILAEELGVPYYNMLSETIVDYDTDLSDPDSHLNPSGARKVTDYMGHILRDELGLEDHRKNSAYKSWEEDYREYQSFLVGNFYSHNNFKERLMLLNNSNFSAKIFLKEGYALDRTEKKLIDQLGESVTIEYVPSLENGANSKIVLREECSGKEHSFVF